MRPRGRLASKKHHGSARCRGRLITGGAVLAGATYVTGMLDSACTAVAGEDARVCGWLDAPRDAMSSVLGRFGEYGEVVLWGLGLGATLVAVVGTSRLQSATGLVGPQSGFWAKALLPGAAGTGTALVFVAAMNTDRTTDA